MKFLYLKGLEVLGPVEVEQLLKESWFSDEVLVCPEDKGEQESAWKIAKDYPEFKKSLEQEIFSAPEKPQESNPEPQPVVADNMPQAPIIKEEKQEQPMPPAAPVVTPAKEASTLESKIQNLPPLENTETESEPDLKKKEETQETPTEKIPTEVIMPALSDEPQDHTFRIPHKEDDNILEDLPSESIFAPSQESNEAPVVLGEEHKAETAEEKVTDHTTPVLDEPLPAVTDDDGSVVNKPTFLEISNNKIISSSDGRVQKEKKNDLMFILCFVALTVISIAVCLAFFNKKEDKTIKTPAFEQEVEAEQQPEALEQNEQVPDDSYGQEAQPDITAEATPSEANQTISIVQNTMLKSKGKTIGEYFNNLYGGGDYQTSWSAKPFTDKIYIVEFFASQVRSEPYVYLFRVDTEKQKITGALNNITLDLIG